MNKPKRDPKVELKNRKQIDVIVTLSLLMLGFAFSVWLLLGTFDQMLPFYLSEESDLLKQVTAFMGFVVFLLLCLKYVAKYIIHNDNRIETLQTIVESEDTDYEKHQ